MTDRLGSVSDALSDLCHQRSWRHFGDGVLVQVLVQSSAVKNLAPANFSSGVHAILSFPPYAASDHLGLGRTRCGWMTTRAPSSPPDCWPAWMPLPARSTEFERILR
jgi:hypothetical protein